MLRVKAGMFGKRGDGAPRLAYVPDDSSADLSGSTRRLTFYKVSSNSGRVKPSYHRQSRALALAHPTQKPS